MATDVRLEEVAKLLPSCTTGADIQSITSTAYFRALERTIARLRDEALASLGSCPGSSTSSAVALSTLAAPASISVSSETAVNETESLISTPATVDLFQSTPDDFDTFLTRYINSLPQDKLTVAVAQCDWLAAVAGLQPSVSLAELRRYEAVGEAYDDLSYADRTT